MARQLELNSSALDARSNAVRAARPSFLPYKLLMKHLLALGVSLLVLAPAPLAAQTAGTGRNLAVVSAGPTGEVASLAEANEIRIVFSEPMVALGRIPAVVRPPYVTISPAIPGAFRWSGTTILIFTPDAKTPLPFATRYDVTVDAIGDSRQRPDARHALHVRLHDADGQAAANRNVSSWRSRRRAVCRPAPVQPAGRAGRRRRAVERAGSRRTSGSGRLCRRRRSSGWLPSTRRR